MEQIELENNDVSIKTTFSESDFYLVSQSLNTLLNAYSIAETIEEQEGIRQKLKKKHKINYAAFHIMRMAFRNRRKYWVLPLKKDDLKQKLEEGKRKYPNDKRYIQFTFNSKNNAAFSYGPVSGHAFESGLSCYSENLLEYIIATYEEIYVIKGRNDLSKEEGGFVRINGKIYDRRYNIAMLKCKLTTTEGAPEENSFDFYDVVHDPGDGN